MKHISVLVPNGEAVLSSIIGPYKVFNKVNEFLLETGKSTEPYYHVQLVGIKQDLDLYDGAFSVKAHTTIDKIKTTDLIIIPAINGDIPKELKNNQAFIPWIKQMHENGAEVASLCLGAFLLASTGLVSGKKCTTHWLGAEAFRQMFPDVELLEQKVVTDESGIYSSGGAYSFLNLILHLVEKYAGREAALWCAKVFEIEIGRETQAQFTIFRGQKGHEDESVKKAQTYIENNIGERISVEKLAEMFALSRRNFIRRFKKATQNTPIEYIQRVKIEAAKKSLESTTDNISEIMYRVGYTDSKAFRNIFRKVTGLSPLEYKMKYNRVFAQAS